MKDLQNKEHYCYKIHILLMKSRAYRPPPPPPPSSIDNPCYMDYPPPPYFYNKILIPSPLWFLENPNAPYKLGGRGFTLGVDPIRLVDGSRFYSSIKVAIHICQIKDLWAKVIVHFLETFCFQSIINFMVISKAAAKNPAKNPHIIIVYFICSAWLFFNIGQ